jgi:hypothetical protein
MHSNVFVILMALTFKSNFKRSSLNKIPKDKEIINLCHLAVVGCDL